MHHGTKVWVTNSVESGVIGKDRVLSEEIGIRPIIDKYTKHPIKQLR